MQCPSCNETLVMSDRNGVEIDYCPKCRGVWLDRGELDKIIERTTSDQSQSYGSVSQQKGYHEQDYKHKKKRKDSFLGDLFDF